MDFRKIITDAMEAQGMTQTALADASGVHRVRINNYLRGIRRDISAESLSKLLDALKLEVRPVRQQRRKG